MTLMKKSVNLFLVVLIVLAVSVIAGLTLYYQDSFRNVADKLTVTYTNLTSCQQTLKITQDELSATKLAVAANQEDVTKTVGLFEEKQQELQTVEQELAAAEKQIKQLQLNITAKNVQITALNQNITSLRAQITALNIEIGDLNDEIDELEEQLDAC